MKKWNLAKILLLAKEKLNSKEQRIFTCRAGATISIYRKRSFYKAHFLSKITECLCRESLYKELSESLDILEKIMGKKINWQAVAQGTSGDILWRKGTRILAIRYVRNRLCHVTMRKFICYCDEHKHNEGVI